MDVVNLPSQLPLLSLLAILIGCSAKGVPADEELQALFTANEASFNQLVAMAEKEKVLFKIHPGIPINPPEYRERAQEYVDLLEEIGIEEPNFTMHRTSKGLFLGVWTKRWTDASVHKSLRYSSIPATPERLLQKSSGNDSSKRLTANWQLQLATSDGDD